MWMKLMMDGGREEVEGRLMTEFCLGAKVLR